MQLGLAAIRSWLVRRLDTIGKFAFELTIVVIGVTAAFALENLRKDAGDRKAVRAGLEALKAEGRMQDMLKKWNLSPEAVEVDGAAAR